jgi:hypothetical protein
MSTGYEDSTIGWAGGLLIAQLQTGRVMSRTRGPSELLRERIGNTWPGAQQNLGFKKVNSRDYLYYNIMLPGLRHGRNNSIKQ